MACVLAALCAMSLSASASASASSPELSVAAESVSVSAVTPGGRVAVVGLMRQVYGVIPGFERWEGIVEDADGDGRVEIALERSADPEWAQWIAVDLRSGEWATAGRSEAAEPSRPLPTGEEVSAGSSLWRLPEGIVEVLVVRPGEGEAAGAWGGSVWDGGSSDADGVADGSAGVSLRSLSPVGASAPAPESYAAGDILIAVTPRALRTGITRVIEGDEEVSR
jgi:hypothetical protein